MTPLYVSLFLYLFICFVTLKLYSNKNEQKANRKATKTNERLKMFLERSMETKRMHGQLFRKGFSISYLIDLHSPPFKKSI